MHLHRKAGANLVLFARRQAELEQVKAACEQANAEGKTGKGGKVTVVVADMSDRKSIDAVSDVPRLIGSGIGSGQITDWCVRWVRRLSRRRRRSSRTSRCESLPPGASLVPNTSAMRGYEPDMDYLLACIQPGEQRRPRQGA